MVVSRFRSTPQAISFLTLLTKLCMVEALNATAGSNVTPSGVVEIIWNLMLVLVVWTIPLVGYCFLSIQVQKSIRECRIVRAVGGHLGWNIAEERLVTIQNLTVRCLTAEDLAADKTALADDRLSEIARMTESHKTVVKNLREQGKDMFLKMEKSSEHIASMIKECAQCEREKRDAQHEAGISSMAIEQMNAANRILQEEKYVMRDDIRLEKEIRRSDKLDYDADVKGLKEALSDSRSKSAALEFAYNNLIENTSETDERTRINIGTYDKEILERTRVAKIRNEEIKELQQHLLDSRDYVHEIKKALQDMTVKKAKTEAFYMEEN